MKSARVLVGLALLAAASGWPFGKPGGEVAPQQPGASASGAALAGLGEVSADELRQAQAMMNDPRFIEQMMSQLKDPKFMSQLKESLASPESRRMMEQMGEFCRPQLRPAVLCVPVCFLLLRTSRCLARVEGHDGEDG